MVLKLIAASVVVISGFAWLSSGSGTVGPAAFAMQIPGVDNVESMTWTDTYYSRVTSKDGSKDWIQKERRLRAYRHPGQYRETIPDQNGDPRMVVITDERSGRILELNLKDKQAVLKSSAHHRDIRGPFAWVGDEIRDRKNTASVRVKSVSLQEQTNLDGKTANVVRAIAQDVNLGIEVRHDFLFDPDSKRLMGVWAPNDANFEFSTAEKNHRDAGSDWSKMEPIAALQHEIELSPKLNPGDFSLDPPPGFTLEKIAPATVTEDEMIAYLRAAAGFNGSTFPDSPFLAYDRDKLNAAWEKDESARSAEANQLIEIVNRIRMREIYQPPVKQFTDDHATPESFHYVGSGVTLGQADRIVCWYRLRATKSLRAVYGDLSVKDVSESDLPLILAK